MMHPSALFHNQFLQLSYSLLKIEKKRNMQIQISGKYLVIVLETS